MNINIIFPMAGDGVRFGGIDFKPFLFATEKLFIELAKESFELLKDKYILNYYFIFRNDQEKSFNVSSKLNILFKNDTIHCCILNNKTVGPVDSVAQAVKLYNIKGPSFMCDCDHKINIKPMIKFIDNYDLIIPVWNIKEEQSYNYGKVILDNSQNILRFCEKEYVPFGKDYIVKGLLGCYYFKDIQMLKLYNSYENMSNILTELNCLKKIVQIEEADFFGTPETLNEFRYKLASRRTILIDFDGTISYLDNKISYNPDEIIIIDGVLEKLNEWKKEGSIIVITTSRSSSKLQELEYLLKNKNIPYDNIITDLTSGPRILINDKKPYNELHKMAIAYEIIRNDGIKHINLEHTPNIIKILKGGSFANTYLIEKESNKIVRKYIKKNLLNNIHYETLKRQYEDLKRFSYYSENLVPKILDSYENENYFYYDMEYLENYEELSKFSESTIKNILPNVINKMKEDIYCYSKKIDGINWLNSFIKEKITAKYEMIANTDNIFNIILNENIYINNCEYKSLKELINSIDANLFINLEVSPIHGDLSLENIMYNDKIKEFCVIDTSGSRYVDIKEMDYAKILQSLIAKYEIWDDEIKLVDISNNSFIISDKFIDLNFNTYSFLFANKLEYKKSVMMLAFYLIRMFPFLLKKSKNHALLGLLLSLYYLSNINSI
jgi:hypothetical protein